MHITLTAALARTDVHVSINGVDAQPGSLDQPVRTLARALELARDTDGGTTIWIGDGIHQITENVQIPEDACGTPGAPLVIRATSRCKAILSGGAGIPASLFCAPGKSPRPDRLPAVARPHVIAASLAGHPDLHALFTPPSATAERPAYAMLTWQGYTLQQARWPNRGYAYIDRATDPGPTTRWGWEPVPYGHAKPIGGRFSAKTDGLLPDQRPLDLSALARELERTHDVTVEGYLSNDWFFQFEPVGRVHADSGEIQILGPTRYGVGNEKMKLHRRFRLINALCQLDEPGEWYYDYAEKSLFLWPVGPPTDDAPVRIAAGPVLIEGKALRHVILRDLVFENFGNEAVILEDCDDVLVGGCEFRTGVGRGLRLSGTHNTITGCDFHDVTSAFSMSGRGENRLSLTLELNQATNNHIHHCRRRGYGLLYIGGVGVRFAHNLLHDQNGGMFYGDNDAVVEYNEFYDMGYEVGDWNVAYNGADLTKVNNQMRYNFVHHLMETPRGYPIAAFRADDGGSGLRADSNILYKCGRSGFECNGPANEIRNNVLMNTKHLWGTLQRPYEQVSRETYLAEKRGEDEKIRGTYVKEDLIGKAERLLGRDFWKRDFVWTQRYPHLREIFGLHDWDHNPWMQGHCRIENNFISGGSTFPVHVHGHNKMDSPEALRNMLPKTTVYEPSHTFDADAVFVAPERLDFRIRDDASLPEGFPRIEFDRIGLYPDEFRPTVPEKAAYRQAVAAKYHGVSSHGGPYELVAINQRYAPPQYLSMLASSEEERRPVGVPGKWTLVEEFSDEFDGPDVNDEKWNRKLAPWGERAWRADNVFQNDGSLHIRAAYAPHEHKGRKYFYTMGILMSHKRTTYGYFEARIKGCSRFPGLCPGFWLFSTGRDNQLEVNDQTVCYSEIDIVEMLQGVWDPGLKANTPVSWIDCNLHLRLLKDGKEKWFRPNGSPEMCKSHWSAPWDPRDDFHLYAVENSRESIVWYIDGKEVARKPNLYWHLPMNLAFTLEARPPLIRWAGVDGREPDPENCTPDGFPTEMTVDYVRCWGRSE